MQSKIKDLFKSITNASDNYDENYMKIEFNQDGDLRLNKMLKLYDMVIVVRSVFLEGNKYYPQAFLDECLQKL